MAAWQFTRAGRKAAQDEWVAFLTLLRGYSLLTRRLIRGMATLRYQRRKTEKVGHSGAFSFLLSISTGHSRNGALGIAPDLT